MRLSLPQASPGLPGVDEPGAEPAPAALAAVPPLKRSA